MKNTTSVIVREVIGEVKTTLTNASGVAITVSGVTGISGTVTVSGNTTTVVSGTVATSGTATVVVSGTVGVSGTVVASGAATEVTLGLMKTKLDSLYTSVGLLTKFTDISADVQTIKSDLDALKLELVTNKGNAQQSTLTAILTNNAAILSLAGTMDGRLQSLSTMIGSGLPIATQRFCQSATLTTLQSGYLSPFSSLGHNSTIGYFLNRGAGRITLLISSDFTNYDAGREIQPGDMMILDRQSIARLWIINYDSSNAWYLLDVL